MLLQLMVTYLTTIWFIFVVNLMKSISATYKSKICEIGIFNLFSLILQYLILFDSVTGADMKQSQIHYLNDSPYLGHLFKKYLST